jgi:hypothetical protein
MSKPDETMDVFCAMSAHDRFLLCRRVMGEIGARVVAKGLDGLSNRKKIAAIFFLRWLT